MRGTARLLKLDVEKPMWLPYIGNCLASGLLGVVGRENSCASIVRLLLLLVPFSVNNPISGLVSGRYAGTGEVL